MVPTFQEVPVFTSQALQTGPERLSWRSALLGPGAPGGRELPSNPQCLVQHLARTVLCHLSRDLCWSHCSVQLGLVWLLHVLDPLPCSHGSGTWLFSCVSNSSPPSLLGCHQKKKTSGFPLDFWDPCDLQKSQTHPSLVAHFTGGPWVSRHSTQLTWKGVVTSEVVWWYLTTPVEIWGLSIWMQTVLPSDVCLSSGRWRKQLEKNGLHLELNPTILARAQHTGTSGRTLGSRGLFVVIYTMVSRDLGQRHVWIPICGVEGPLYLCCNISDSLTLWREWSFKPTSVYTSYTFYLIFLSARKGSWLSLGWEIYNIYMSFPF